MDKWSLGNTIVNKLIIMNQFSHLMDEVVRFEGKYDGVYFFVFDDYPLKYTIEFCTDDDFWREIPLGEILDNLELNFFQITESLLAGGEFHVLHKIGFNRPMEINLN